MCKHNQHHPDIFVYEITETAYWQLCKNMYGSDIDLAPSGEYIVVECLIGYDDVASVRPVFGHHSLFPAVEDTARCIDRAERTTRHNCILMYEIWRVMPDYLLSAVYAPNPSEPEHPSSDAVSPVVFATEPDTGKQLVFTPDKRRAQMADALETAMIAISQGYDNVGIAWMRSDWAVSQLLASCHLYMLGYSLCNAIPDRLGVVTDGRD